MKKILLAGLLFLCALVAYPAGLTVSTTNGQAFGTLTLNGFGVATTNNVIIKNGGSGINNLLTNVTIKGTTTFLTDNNADDIIIITTPGVLAFGSTSLGAASLVADSFVGGFIGNGAGLTNLPFNALSLAGRVAVSNAVSGALNLTNAATLYVDAKGDDATGVRGNFALKFKTLAAANTAASAGDTIYIGSGSNYVAAAVTLKAVTLKGEGYASKLVGTAITSLNPMLVVALDNTEINNLWIESNASGIGVASAGVVTATNIVLRNLFVKGGANAQNAVGWSGVNGAGNVFHNVVVQLWNCEVYSIQNNSMGVNVGLGASGYVRLFNCKVTGQIDGFFGSGSGVAEIFGGDYVATDSDAITSGGATVQVYGGKARGPGNDLFNDGGTLLECGVDYDGSNGTITHCIVPSPLTVATINATTLNAGTLNLTNFIGPQLLGPTNGYTDGQAWTIDHGSNKLATISGGGGNDPRFTSSAGTITAGSNNFTATAITTSGLVVNGSQTNNDFIQTGLGIVTLGTVTAAGNISGTHVGDGGALVALNPANVTASGNFVFKTTDGTAAITGSGAGAIVVGGTLKAGTTGAIRSTNSFEVWGTNTVNPVLVVNSTNKHSIQIGGANIIRAVNNAGTEVLTFADNGVANLVAVIASFSLSTSGDITAGGGNSYLWSSRTKITSPTDGAVTLKNNAGSGFGTLLLHGSGISNSVNGAEAVDAIGNRTNWWVKGLSIGNGTLVASRLTATATLDFGSILAAASADLTITVTGAAVNDSVDLGPPAGLEATVTALGIVTSANTVTVRLFNVGTLSVDPASATWRASVTHY